MSKVPYLKTEGATEQFLPDRVAKILKYIDICAHASVTAECTTEEEFEEIIRFIGFVEAFIKNSTFMMHYQKMQEDAQRLAKEANN